MAKRLVAVNWSRGTSRPSAVARNLSASLAVLVVLLWKPVAAAAQGAESDAAEIVTRNDPVPRPTVGYAPDSGAFLRTPDGAWELNPYAMVQITSVTTGGHALPDASGFNLHAAKFILHGHVYAPTLTYHFQLNAGEGKVVAEDLYLRWDARP